MVWDTNMSDVEGLCGYIYVHLQSEGGLICPERDGREEEVDHWKAGGRREMVWDICMIHGVFIQGGEEGGGNFHSWLIQSGWSATGPVWTKMCFHKNGMITFKKYRGKFKKWFVLIDSLKKLILLKIQKSWAFATFFKNLIFTKQIIFEWFGCWMNFKFTIEKLIKQKNRKSVWHVRIILHNDGVRHVHKMFHNIS